MLAGDVLGFLEGPDVCGNQKRANHGEDEGDCFANENYESRSDVDLELDVEPVDGTKVKKKKKSWIRISTMTIVL